MSKQSKEKKQGALGPKERWSARRKREVVLRLLRDEPLDGLSREVGVEVCRDLLISLHANKLGSR